MKTIVLNQVAQLRFQSYSTSLVKVLEHSWISSLAPLSAELFKGVFGVAKAALIQKRKWQLKLFNVIAHYPWVSFALAALLVLPAFYFTWGGSAAVFNDAVRAFAQWTLAADVDRLQHHLGPFTGTLGGAAFTLTRLRPPFSAAANCPKLVKPVIQIDAA